MRAKEDSFKKILSSLVTEVDESSILGYCSCCFIGSLQVPNSFPIAIRRSANRQKISIVEEKALKYEINRRDPSNYYYVMRTKE